MKVWGKKVVEQRVLIMNVCDVCKKEIKKKDSFDISYATIEGQRAESYPGYISGTKYHIDICPDCFEDKVIPLFEKHLSVEFAEDDID